MRRHVDAQCYIVSIIPPVHACKHLQPGATPDCFDRLCWSHSRTLPLPPADCKEIKVSKPLPATASSAGSPASICGTTNSTMSTISGADWRLLSTCLNKPTPQCYIRAQEILLQTGCVDCLPYLQEHDTRANAYCSERASKRDCEAASAPCQKESLIRAPRSAAAHALPAAAVASDVCAAWWSFGAGRVWDVRMLTSELQRCDSVSRVGSAAFKCALPCQSLVHASEACV